jgi:hypothetical protein
MLGYEKAGKKYRDHVIETVDAMVRKRNAELEAVKETPW